MDYQSVREALVLSNGIKPVSVLLASEEMKRLALISPNVPLEVLCSPGPRSPYIHLAGEPLPLTAG